MSVARNVYLTAVVGAGSLVLAWSAIDVARAFPGWVWLVIVAMTCLTGWSAVRMPGFPASLSLSDAFTIIAALLFGPSAGALTVACDALAMSAGLKRPQRTWRRLLFNATAPALAMWSAASLFFLMLGTGPAPLGNRPPGSIVIPLAVFATVYFLLNTGLVATAVAIGRDASLPAVWRRHFLPLWWTHFAGTSISGLLLLLMSAGLATLETLLVALPIIIVVVAAAVVGVARLRKRSAEVAKLRSYAAALQCTGDGIILADDRGRATFMNPAAERLTGWPRRHALGRHLSEVFHVDAADDALDYLNLDRSNDPPRQYSLRRRDGTVCPIEETHAWMRDADGTVTGVIRTFRDVSPRQALEEERTAVLVREQEARAIAEDANRTKDEFLATLSHELRTPATAIIGWTNLLTAGRLDDAGVQKALAAIDRSARAQASVLNDLLDSSRIVRGALSLDMRRVALPQVVKDAVETVDPSARAKQIAIHVEFEPDLPTIDADPDRLRQVFWNLLSNAVKFTPAGGSVSVVTARDGDAATVTVCDDGSGITPEFLPFVFDRFRQADGSDVRAYSGLGLGLAIVRHLVEAHGGTVEASSDGPGCGATFVVRLPAANLRRATDPAFDETAAASTAAEPFEHLITEMLQAEGADDAGWRAILRADAYTFQPIAGPSRKVVIDGEVEKTRRVLAMVFARSLQAYGVRPHVPARWSDRRDPRRQAPTAGGRREMDVSA